MCAERKTHHVCTVERWLSGSAVRALDTRPKGPRFNAQPMQYQVTTLGKLFTPTCLCRCKCLVVSVDSIRFLLPSFASHLEQVANLRCAQANSASYPSWDGKWVVAYGLRGAVLVRLIGAMVCLLAASRGSIMFADAGNGWPHSALRYH